MNFDQSIFQVINGLSGTSSFLDLAGVFFAEYLPYFFIIAAAVFIFLSGRWQAKFHNFALMALSVILARGIFIESIRFFYFRPRPPFVSSIQPLIESPTSSAFPSGHAAIFFALALAIWYFNRRLGVISLASAAIISLGRIFVGVHWPSDVLVGALIGILSAFIIKKLLDKTAPFYRGETKK